MMFSYVERYIITVILYRFYTIRRQQFHLQFSDEVVQDGYWL